MALAVRVGTRATERVGALSLDSKDGNVWKMQKADAVHCGGETISGPSFDASSWLDAHVPGTVLNSLVMDGIYPDPYYGTNNKLSSGKIPDLATAGRDFYTYWWRTEFVLPPSFEGKRVRLGLDGINYRAEIWFNGRLLGVHSGMFREFDIDITRDARIGEKNALALKVFPVDSPGTFLQKSWGAPGEINICLKT